jgi:hypothetical protein
MDEANRQLLEQGMTKMKGRLTTNSTQPGVNRACYAPPFSQPALYEALRLVSRGCDMRKSDVKAYYTNFPFAREFWWMCWVVWGVGLLSTLWRFVRVYFGLRPAPYFTSAFSAEFAVWFRHAGVDPAWMMDDWFVVGDTPEQSEERMAVLTTMLEGVGFVLVPDKAGHGRQLVFLGVLIDSERMTIRFDATQCRGVLAQLRDYYAKFAGGRFIDATTLNHMCGKLTWFSQVLQAGRGHIQSWWRAFRWACVGAALPPSELSELLADTNFWIYQVKWWSEGHSSGSEYPILCASELLACPHSILFLQSDCSGPDGIGYFYGYGGEVDHLYRTVAWELGGVPRHSHIGELKAVQHALHEMVDGTAGLQGPPPKILLSIMDSQSAVWAVNKGRSKDPSDHVVVMDILSLADYLNVDIIALWVPRESLPPCC